MAKTYLWKGYHHPSLVDLLKTVWENDDLLILYPPPVKSFDFLPWLPPSEVECLGEWETEISTETMPELGSLATDYPGRPVIGVFTTGTTGNHPKLVLFSKQNIVACLEGIRSFFDVSKIESLFCYPQPYHVFGINLGYVHSLVYDLPLHAGEGPYASSHHVAWLDALNRGQLTLGTPTHLQDLLHYCRNASLTPKRSYSCIMGGAQVPKKLWRDVQKHLRIEAPSVGYGATEASPGITHLPPGEEPLCDGDVGYQLPDIELRWLDRRGFEFRGENVCLATIQDGKLTFHERYVVPDQLEKRPDGRWLYKGRLALTLNRGGEKFSLENLENFIKDRFGLETICVPVPHSRLGEELGLLAQGKLPPKTKQSIYEALSSEFCREFDPRNYCEIERFPTNANSKIDRHRSRMILMEHCLGRV